MASNLTVAISPSKISSLYLAFPIPPESKCIHLLTIHAPLGAHGDGSPIQGTLSVVDLSQRPSFTALSYVWGANSIAPKTIVCQGSTISVTDSCHSALIHLRRKLKTFTIWIDAVCIDQEEDDEKSQQLLLMGDIYSGAQLVYVWLGEGTPATDRAINLLSRTGFLEYFFVGGNPNGDIFPKSRTWAAFWSSYFVRWTLRRQPLPILDHNSSKTWLSRAYERFMGSLTVSRASHGDLGELLSTQWVRRIWTYQEIILATNPVVVCGDAHIAWSIFSTAIIFLDYTKIDYHPTASTFSTWKKLVFTRESIANAVQRARLRRYQEFLHEISQKHIKLRKMRSFVYLSCFLMLGTFVVLMLFFNIENKTHSLENSTTGSRMNLTASAASSIVSSAYASATACATSCQAQHQNNQNECVDACFKPDGVVTAALSRLQHLHYNYQRALPLLLIPILVLSFLLLNHQFARYGSFPRLNMAKCQMEIRAGESDDLVDGISTRKASNPKDMAFGFRSVLSKLLNTNLSAPDYKIGTGGIYKELVIHVLDTTGSLQFLIPASLQRLPQCEAQPSWVPDWSADFPQYWLKPYLSFQLLKNAAPGSRPIWRFDTQRTILSVHGRQICSIESCLDFQTTSDTYEGGEQAIHLRNIQIMLEISRLCGSPMEHNAPELRDLLLNPLNHPDLPDDISGDYLYAYLRSLHDNNRKKPVDILKMLRSGGHMRRFNLLALGFFDAFSYRALFHIHISICNSMAKTARKLFRVNDLRILSTSYHWGGATGTDRYGNLTRPHAEPGTLHSAGICAGDARAGDEVVIISGLPVPLVIRRIAGLTHLVSPAIVVGAMEGQAWAKDDEPAGRHNSLEVIDLT